MKYFMMVLLLSGALFAADKKQVKVFVSEHESWQQASTVVAGTYTGATHSEQVKTLSDNCPSITITDDQKKADVILKWDSKTWQQTSWGGHENEYSIFDAGNDLLASGATHHMKNAAKDICKMIEAKVQQ